MRQRARFGRAKSSCAPQCSNLKGFVGTRYPTSSKKSVVAGSTCEAEYIAASKAAIEGVWMKEFISDLGVIPSASGSTKIFCNNTRAIALAKESRFHKRTKHVKRRFNSIHESVKDGDIKICKIHTDLNVADPLTKPLPQSKT